MTNARQLPHLIIGLSGKKQSGKNTVCSGLFSIFEKEYGAGCASLFSFADALKENVCIDTMGLSREQCYGSDAQKNELTPYLWDKLPREIRHHNHRGIVRAPNGEICEFILPKGNMSAREIMQVVGTDIFRNFFDDSIWVNATFRDIKKNNYPFSLISDVRFPSEVNGILDNGGIVIRLLRDICSTDAHPSETSLDDFDWSKDNCFVIDNREMSIEKQAEEAFSIIKDRYNLELK